MDSLLLAGLQHSTGISLEDLEDQIQTLMPMRMKGHESTEEPSEFNDGSIDPFGGKCSKFVGAKSWKRGRSTGRRNRSGSVSEKKARKNSSPARKQRFEQITEIEAVHLNSPEAVSGGLLKQKAYETARVGDRDP